MKLTHLAALVLLPALSTSAFADFFDNERADNLAISQADQSAEVFYRTGALGTGKSTTHSVSLREGGVYAIYTDCAPSSCENVDMELLHNGRVVKEDHMDDTYPLFKFSPSSSGTYTIRVKMAQCKPGHASCAYHTQVIKEN